MNPDQPPAATDPLAGDEPAVQEFVVTYRNPESLSEETGRLRIGADNRWRLFRLAPDGSEPLVFDLPAGEAWDVLEELKADGSLWDATEDDRIVVNYLPSWR